VWYIIVPGRAAIAVRNSAVTTSSTNALRSRTSHPLSLLSRNTRFILGCVRIAGIAFEGSCQRQTCTQTVPQN